MTLTYRPEELPVNGSLDVSHWQKFAKRARKKLGRFRFLACGEYGEQDQRPHYHACLFGIDFRRDQVLLKKKNNYNVYTSKSLEELWQHGFVTVSPFSPAAASYVAGYVMKKQFGVRSEAEYGNRKPPFATMSRRPGLGHEWFDKYCDEVYPDDFVVHEGKEVPVPRYYDKLLERKNPLLAQAVVDTRVMRARRNRRSPDELAAKEAEQRFWHGARKRQPG